jgi:hypothetical protein
MQIIKKSDQLVRRAVKELTQFQTSDGQTFEHLPTAKDHQLGVDVREAVWALADKEGCPDAICNEIAAFVHKYRHRLLSWLKGEDEHEL